jgi:transcriptional regulator with XRE-family HTH domain
MTGTPSTHNGMQRWTTILDGRRLRQLRREHGLSREQLATHAGISLTTIRRLEHQPAAPCRSRTLGRLATALGEDPARLTPANPRPQPRHP